MLGEERGFEGRLKSVCLLGGEIVEILAVGCRNYVNSVQIQKDISTYLCD